MMLNEYTYNISNGFLNLEKHTLSSKAQKNCLKLTASPSAVKKSLMVCTPLWPDTSIHYWERPTVCMACIYYCAIKNECC